VLPLRGPCDRQSYIAVHLAGIGNKEAS
jgi:hypothetical protein